MTHNIKSNSFSLATTHTIGSYIVPGLLNEKLKSSTSKQINISIHNCFNVIEGIENKEFDLGLIETPLSTEMVKVAEWISNEMIIYSNTELPPYITKDKLSNYKLIVQPQSSPIQALVNNFLHNFNIEYSHFNSIRTIDNTTASIQSVKWSKSNQSNPTIGIVSKFAIEEEINRKVFFTAQFEKSKMIHKFYIVIHKDSIENRTIQNIIKTLNLYALENPKT